MRTNTEPTFVQTSNIGETKKASIKTSAKMFNFFSKQVYSDYYTAIWRELVANAIDAQKLTGEKRSPVVTVPSMLEPYAKVRDFGCSMDHDFMMNNFMAFGDASTKEDSDDFIGGFGIGSKAPLSYTDQYSIRCFMNGTVRVYSIFKDAEGCPSIAFLSEEGTSEPDGVEVAFPVRQEDIEKFTGTVVKTLNYFDPVPVLENTVLELKPVEYQAKGKNWGIRVGSNDRAPRVVIGGVAYPLNVSQIPYEYQTLRNYASFGLDIYLPIGEANIALSREQITHDKELFEKLSKIITNIATEFGAQFSQQFAKCQTEWEAKALLADALKSTDHVTGNILRKNAIWKGSKLSVKIEKPADFECLIIAYGYYNYNHNLNSIITTEAVSPKFRAWADYATFEPQTFDMIVLDDEPDKPSLRIRGCVEQNSGKRILFVRWNDAAKAVDWAGFLKALGSPPEAMVSKLSAYTPVKITRAAPTGAASRPFKCYIKDNVPYRGSDHYASDQLPAGGGMYIQMDNFDPLEKSSDIAIAKMGKPANIVWLNKTDFNSSNIDKDPDWHPPQFFIDKVKAGYRSKHKKLAEAEAWTNVSCESKRHALTHILEKLSKLPNFPKQGPLAKLNKLRLEHEKVATVEHSDIRINLLGVKWEAKADEIRKLFDEVDAKHPLIWELSQKHQIRHNASNDLINALF